MARLNRKLAQPDGRGGWRLRVHHRKARGKMLPRLLIKCGCCDKSVEIYYGGDSMEIGGVYASLDEWRAILEPLLAGRDPFKAADT